MSDFQPDPSDAPVGAQPDSWSNTSLMICEVCQARFLPLNGGAADATAPLQRCPQCYQAELVSQALSDEIQPFIHPAELAIPFALSTADIDQAVQRFANGIPFPPSDLTGERLRSRLNRIYLPMWLVDAQVKAEWQAEAGFNYRVISRQERYSAQGWSSQPVEEQRIRWEPRLGRLQRAYQNIVVPALEDHRRLQAALGEFDLRQAQPYQIRLAQNVLLRLPDRPPQAAWSEAKPALQSAAAEECRRAARADHLRRFAWRPKFNSLNWTLLLLPVYTTYYLDDEGHPQAVWINGKSGQLSGRRRASPSRARRAALIWLIAAAICFLISLALAAASTFAPLLLALAVLALTFALLAGIGAATPLLRVWWFNRPASA